MASKRKIFTNKWIRSTIDSCPNDILYLKEFEERCISFLKLLDSTPNEFYMKKVTLKEWAWLQMEDPEKAYMELAEEINTDIKFVATVTLFKANKLIVPILNGLDIGEIYIPTILIRTLMEISSICYYTMHRLSPIIAQMNKSLYNFYEYNSLSTERENVMQSFRNGTWDDTILKISPDAVKAKGMPKPIEYIISTTEHSEFGKRYGIFSEITHPNSFSYDIFGSVTRLYEKDIKILDDSSIGFIHGEKEKFYKEMPTDKREEIMSQLFLPLLHVTGICIELITESLNLSKKLIVNKLQQTPPILFYINLLTPDELEMFKKEFDKIVFDTKEDVDFNKEISTIIKKLSLDRYQVWFINSS